MAKTKLPPQPKAHGTGSILKARRALIAAEEYQIENRNKPFRRLQEQFMRQRREILTKPVVTKAEAIFQQHKDAFNSSFLTFHGDGSLIAERKRRARQSIERALRKTVPGYERYERLRERYARDYRRLLGARLAANRASPLDIALGELHLPDELVFQEFTPPYELEDVTTIDWNGLIRRNDSFAQANSGFVVNNLDFFRNENGMNAFYNPPLWADTRSAVGVNYRVPKTGFLHGFAHVQNLFNRIVLSLKDNFGFSSGHLHFEVKIYITIVRSEELVPFERIIVSNGLVSHGNELSGMFNEIPDLVPFSVRFTSKDAFLKGETIQVIAGSSIFIQSNIDEMKSFVNALLWWQVKKIGLAIGL